MDIVTSMPRPEGPVGASRLSHGQDAEKPVRLAQQNDDQGIAASFSHMLVAERGRPAPVGTKAGTGTPEQADAKSTATDQISSEPEASGSNSDTDSKSLTAGKLPVTPESAANLQVIELAAGANVSDAPAAVMATVTDAAATTEAESSSSSLPQATAVASGSSTAAVAGTESTPATGIEAALQVETGPSEVGARQLSAQEVLATTAKTGAGTVGAIGSGAQLTRGTAGAAVADTTASEVAIAQGAAPEKGSQAEKGVVKSPAVADTTPTPQDPATAKLAAAAEKSPAPLTAQKTAQALDSAAKAEQVYSKPPVVSEAQILAGSLKQERGPVPTAMTRSAAGTLTDAISAGSDGLAIPTAEESTAPLAAPSEPAAPETGAASEAALDEATALASTEASPSDAPAVKPESETAVTEAAKHEPTHQDKETASGQPAALATPLAAEGELAASGVKTTPGGKISPAVSHKVHAQVTRQFARQLSEISGNERVSIKLNPESLGEIEVRFESRDDRLSVVMTASTSQAEAALRDNMKDLTDRIMERSARFNHVDVKIEVRDNGDARQDNRSGEKQDGRQEQRRGSDQHGERRGNRDQGDHQQAHARAAKQSWEKAMNWHLAAESASEEG